MTLIGNALVQNEAPRLFPGIAIEYLKAGYLFLSSMIVLTGMGLKGVEMMWKMKKKGFYLYVATKILIYFLPVLLIGNSHLTYPGLIITSIMITLYGIVFLIFTEIQQRINVKKIKKTENVFGIKKLLLLPHGKI